MEVLVILDNKENNSEKIKIPDTLTVSGDLWQDQLHDLIEKTFKLEKGRIDRLQIFSTKFNCYENLKLWKDVRDGTRINAVLKVSFSYCIVMLLLVSV